MKSDQFIMGDLFNPSRIIRNKAKLEDGRIVEYDRCCSVGSDNHFGPGVVTTYLGRGEIYEVNGVIQTRGKPMIYDFYSVTFRKWSDVPKSL